MSKTQNPKKSDYKHESLRLRAGIYVPGLLPEKVIENARNSMTPDERKDFDSYRKSRAIFATTMASTALGFGAMGGLIAGIIPKGAATALPAVFSATIGFCGAPISWHFAYHHNSAKFETRIREAMADYEGKKKALKDGSKKGIIKTGILTSTKEGSRNFKKFFRNRLTEIRPSRASLKLERAAMAKLTKEEQDSVSFIKSTRLMALAPAALTGMAAGALSVNPAIGTVAAIAMHNTVMRLCVTPSQRDAIDAYKTALIEAKKERDSQMDIRGQKAKAEKAKDVEIIEKEQKRARAAKIAAKKRKKLHNRAAAARKQRKKDKTTPPKP